MAIWQFRLILIPEKILLSRYEVLPLRLSQKVAENVLWWSDVQPVAGFEKWIDLILTQAPSWSSSMRMWGEKRGNEAYVCYADLGMTIVEEIAFRIDVREISSDFIHQICVLAKQLDCVLMTTDYSILVPDEACVLTAMANSTAQKYLVDPASALSSIDQRQFDHLNDLEKHKRSKN